MTDETWFAEPFGADYESPPAAPCPDCECCTARLCQKAVTAGLSCVWFAGAADKEIVSGCPCSRGGR
jgi:hypothetical protein